MSREKQIEEMEKIIQKRDDEAMYASIAHSLYNAGYRKIPEGAIILTKEEIAALNEYQLKHFIGSEPNEE